jgi:hypothetical protein
MPKIKCLNLPVQLRQHLFAARSGVSAGETTAWLSVRDRPFVLE